MKIYEIEGCDCTGKTTLFWSLENVVTHDKAFFESLPSSRYREKIVNRKIPLKTELASLLFAADRYEAIERMIESKKDIAFLDRYLMSTVVYQGEGDEIKINEIIRIHEYLKLPYPTKGFLLTASPETVFERKTKRGTTDVYELEGFEKRLELYKQAYEILSEKYPIVIINTTGKEKLQVFKEVINLIP